MSDFPDFLSVRLLLERASVPFNVIHHEEWQSTTDQSAARGHLPELAVKSLFLEGLTQHGIKVSLLCAVPGNRRVSYDSVREITGLRRIFAMPRKEAERLMSCPSGSFPPFCLANEVQHVFDRSFDNTSRAVVIGSGCLKESYWVDIRDIVQIANPMFGRIAIDC